MKKIKFLENSHGQKVKVVGKNAVVYVRSFAGAPLVRCTLKGVMTTDSADYYVVKPLETAHGYYRGVIDTAREVIPAGCFRWSNRDYRYNFKPFQIADSELPFITDLDEVN